MKIFSAFSPSIRFAGQKFVPVVLLQLLLFSSFGYADRISGFLWNDLNRDGLQDIGEPGLTNVAVVLRDAASNLVDAVAADSGGTYEFTGMPPGDYYMEFNIYGPDNEISDAWQPTLQNQGTNVNIDSDIDLGGIVPLFSFSGVAITNLDAGYFFLVPDVGVIKLASDEVYTAPDGDPLYVTNGTWVTYTYVVTNSGETRLSTLVLYDDVLDAFLIELNCPDFLVPGGTLSFSTTVVINASVTNIAEVFAIPVSKRCTPIVEFEPVFETNDAVVIVVDPSVDIVKTLTSPFGRPTEAGETNIFAIVITNTGDVSLDVVPLEDRYDTSLLSFVAAIPPHDSFVPGTINWTNVGPLAVGQSVTVTTWFAAVNIGIGTNYVITTPTNITIGLPVEPADDDEPYETIAPNLELFKDLVSVSEPDLDGYFTVAYTITVTNAGNSITSYDLSDLPDFDPNITVLSNNVSGQISQNFPGAGAYTLASGVSISGGAAHFYNLLIYAQLSEEVLTGEASVTLCARDQIGFVAGQGLFNEATVNYGIFDTEITDDACGEVPPVLVLNKDFVSASEADLDGNFVVTYTITVENTGGSSGSYDLSDAPDFDSNITALSNNVSGQITQNFPGGGPYTLATGAAIGAGDTHTYTLMIYAQLSAGVLDGESAVSLCEEGQVGFVPGQGLFNEATVVYGQRETTISDDACGEVPPVLVLEKDFVSASEPDLDGNFVVTYTITVENTGGSAGSYDLSDTPDFDSNITALSNNVSGQITQNFPGGGPYTLATGAAIGAGATHTYTLMIYAQVSEGVLNGESSVSLCEEGQVGFVSGQGLFNEATVVYGVSQLTITDDACGEVPPVLVLDKDFVSATEPDLDGNFEVTYTITVLNFGGSEGTYDLTDAPDFDGNIIVNGATVSGQVNLNLPGSGPYTLATGMAIAAGDNHSYTLIVSATLEAVILDGDSSVSLCEVDDGGYVSGQGLFNEATVVYGVSQLTITDDACGEVPPVLVLNKDFDSASEADLDGNFVVTYTITVENTGGSTGSYDLTDTPDFDANITVLSNNVSGQISENFPGGGPYTLAVGTAIGAGDTHTYTLTIYAQLNQGVLSGESSVTQCEDREGELVSGQGLFNQATVVYGDSELTINDEACGDVPPFLILVKLFDNATEPDLDGNFSVYYTISVQNVGGSSGAYDLTDTPGFDTNIFVNSASVSGQVVLNIPGAGPYTLATGETIAAGDTHNYNLEISATLGVSVLSGENSVSECEAGDVGLVSGQGLYNQATVVYGDSQTTIDAEDCGEVPPFLILNKEFLSATEPAQDGTFSASYVLTIQNVGGTFGQFDLTDTPSFDGNISVTGATVTSSQVIQGSLLGQPTYTRADAGGYNAACALPASLSGVGVNVPYAVFPIVATSADPFTAFVAGGVSDPYMFLYCDFDPNDSTINLLAANDDFAGLQSGFDSGLGISRTPGETNYLVITLFSPGSLGSGYFNVVLSNAAFDSSIDFVGAGPYEIATNAIIGPASTVTYTVTVYGVLSLEVLSGETSVSRCGETTDIPQAGEGLFNESVLIYGESVTTITNEACGDVPPFLIINKTYLSSTVPDNAGSFSATYRLEVINSGGSEGEYDLTDTPGFDTNIVVNSASVSGQAVLNIPGAGPYTLATGETIASGVLHTYTVQVFAVLSEAVRRGTATVSSCGTGDEGAAPGQGLYNLATVIYGAEDTEISDDDCGDLILPPGLFIGDTVWVDANSNGSPDENLALFGLNNVRVDLFQAIGGVTNFVGFRMTGPGPGQLGYYAFTNLPPYGTYIAQVVLSSPPLSGFPVATTPLRYTLNTLTDFPGGVRNDIDFGFNNEYGTPIELKSFTARPLDGGAQLAWETEWEVQTLGYNLYRASAHTPDVRIQINGALIPGLGSDNGHAYTHMDWDVDAGDDYLYWLEEVATFGDTELYGPVAVHVGEIAQGATLARATLEAGEGALVRIRYETLVAAGIPLSQLQTAQLQVLIDGREVARFISADRESLQVGDYILFYAPASAGDQEVAIRLSDSDDARSMEWVYARPRAGGGEVGLAEAGEEGQTTFAYAPEYVRLLITGFTSPMVWALNITDPDAPAILYGQAVVAGGQTGQQAVYMSIATEDMVQGFAVQDERVVELEQFNRE